MITDHYLAARSSEGRNVGWRFELSTPLTGVADLYSLQFRGSEIRIHGYRPPDGWLDGGVKAAADAILQDDDGGELDVEGGRLLYRTPSFPAPAGVAPMLARLDTLAVALQRVL